MIRLSATDVHDPRTRPAPGATCRLASVPSANFRDLGGLPTEDGATTRSTLLYRGDAPLAADGPPADTPVWPPALVLDLRSDDEPVEPHPLRAAGTDVHRFPLLGAARPRTLAEMRAGEGLSFDALYARIAEQAGRAISTVLELLIRADGPAFVHCAAGKDRTGVLVAVLLRAAGIRRDAIVADSCAPRPR